jgi:hypothetical protein
MAASAGKLAAALHRWMRRVASALVYAALEWVLIALLLNQQPARLRHRHIRGLLRASSSVCKGASLGTGKGALSGRPLRPEQDRHGRCIRRRHGSCVRTDTVSALVSPIKDCTIQYC